MIVTKTCKDCGEEKPAKDFWYNSKTKDRLKTSCISCCKEYNKRHYEANKERRIKQVKEWQSRST
jgi:hypothetical protein